MAELHQHGVDLLINVLDAADHIEQMSKNELRTLLNEVAEVLGDLLKRDIPQERHE